MALNSGTEPSSVCTFYVLFCIGEKWEMINMSLKLKFVLLVYC